MIQFPQYIQDFLVSFRNHFEGIKKALETIAKVQSLQLEENILYVNRPEEEVYYSKEEVIKILKKNYPQDDPEQTMKKLLIEGSLLKCKIL